MMMGKNPSGMVSHSVMYCYLDNYSQSREKDNLIFLILQSLSGRRPGIRRLLQYSLLSVTTTSMVAWWQTIPRPLHSLRYKNSSLGSMGKYGASYSIHFIKFCYYNIVIVTSQQLPGSLVWCPWVVASTLRSPLGTRTLLMLSRSPSSSVLRDDLVTYSHC